jgi:NTP pyrophosphatase (non-canonical NTP hydrolase)
MNFNSYQVFVGTTALYPNHGHGDIAYPVLGLASEAGEVAGVAKRVLRDDGGKLTEARKNELLDELGDVLWYIAALATELDTPLEDIAMRNYHKLGDRAVRGVIQGKGDKR